MVPDLDLFNWSPKKHFPWCCQVLLEKMWVGAGDAGIRYVWKAFPNQYHVGSDKKLTPLEAEQDAWEKYQQILPKLCKHDHDNPLNCERRTYRNGCGFCIHCGHFCSNIFEPLEVCNKCGTKTYWTATDQFTENELCGAKIVQKRTI